MRNTRLYLYILFFFIFILVLAVSVNAVDLYVDDGRPASWYDETHVRTVQEANDNASDGDTIYIYEGLYEECVDINKSVTIIGNSSSLSVVKWDNVASDSIFTIKTDFVNISGLKFNSTDTIDIGIKTGDFSGYCNNLRIESCVFEDIEGEGIYLVTNNSYIGNCTFENISRSTSYAIWAQSDNVTVFNGTVNNTGSGITLTGNDNLISFCDISNVTGGEACGFENNFYPQGQRNIISNCTLQYFGNNGFYGTELEYCIIRNNTFVSSEAGATGIYLEDSINNYIYNNYIVSPINVYDNNITIGNIWNITKTLGTNIIGGPYLGGNFWSDYTGYDLDDDGIGDTDIPFGPGDYFPLSYGYFERSFSVKYENYTYGFVNISKGNAHKFLVQYNNRTEINWFINGSLVYNETNIENSDPTNGTFDINVTQVPLWYEFHWNDTYNNTGSHNPYRCNRVIVPSSLNETNLTFYIFTDKLVYGESTAYYNNSLIKYHWSFIDETGQFQSPNNPFVIIYTYDDDENQMVIHSEYFDASNMVHPWLLYEKRYFVAVTCNLQDFYKIGTSPTFTDTEPILRIPVDTAIDYNFFDLITLKNGKRPGYIFSYYTDATGATETANFYIYNFTNNNLIHHETTSLSTFNFTFTTAEGYNRNVTYKLYITTLINDTANIYDGNYSSGYFTFYADYEPITNTSRIDDILNKSFGDTPFYNPDTGAEVSWTYVLIFSSSFFFLVSFGRFNAFLGMLSVGVFLGVCGIFISGTGFLLVFAALLVGLAFIGLLGGVEKR